MIDKPIEQRYDEAVENEQFVRNAAYTGAPERIGEFRVKPLTLRQLVSLQAVGSPFVNGAELGEINPDELVKEAVSFLWRLSPDYSATNQSAKRKLEKQCRKLWRGKPVNFYETVIKIQKFIDETYMDSPSQACGFQSRSYFSDAAGICDLFFPWPNDVTLDTPLKQLFQQMKLMRSRDRAKEGKPAALVNPSDRIINEMLEEENLQLQLERELEGKQ